MPPENNTYCSWRFVRCVRKVTTIEIITFYAPAKTKKKSHMTTFFLLLSWIMMSNSLFYGLRELHHPSAFSFKSPQQNSKSLSALLKSNRDTCFKYMAKLFDRGGSTSDKWFKRWVRADRLASNHIIIAFLVFTASNGSWHLVDVDLTRLGFDLQFDLCYSKLWQCL